MGIESLLYSWMAKLSNADESIFCLETRKWFGLEEIIQEFSHPKNESKESLSQKKSNKIVNRIRKSSPIMLESFPSFLINETFFNFIATSLIIIIALYLLACTIAPVVNLNSQMFRVIFTIVGGVPSILFYSKNQTDKKFYLSNR